MDTVWGILGALGTIFAIYAYYNRFSPDYKEARENAAQKFDFLMRLNASLIAQLKDFSNKYDAYDAVISPGITFRSTIDKLEEVKTKILTDENYEAIHNTKTSLRNIEDILDSLKIQIESHSGLQTNLELIQNHINNKERGIS